jgi:multiple sugar transport system permease protein
MNEINVGLAPGGKIAARSVAKKRRRTTSATDNLTGYLFISPWLITFLVFTAIPMAISLWLAFTDYDLLGSWSFIGLDNFKRMFFEDTRYIKSVVATLKYVVIAVPLRLAFALAVAMLLNTYRRGVTLYRAAYYAPSVVGGSIAVAVMWRQIFGTQGAINALLAVMGIDGPSWFGNPTTAIWTLIIMAAWQFGSPMLIFLAGLRQIPRELYEAASIDGANAWYSFWRVTFPLLTPIIFFNLIMQMIHGLRAFTQAFIITEGRPLDSTLFYALYLYQRAFVTFHMGYASAMAWVLLLVIGIVTALNFKLSSLWVHYEANEV